MRRSHLNQHYEPLLPHGSDDALQEANDQMTDDLKNKISALKSLSIDIGAEVKYQDKILRDFDDDMERSGSFLSNTRNRVLRLARGGHNYYILYLFLFSLFVFFVLWLILKFR
ncbi:hypothetical protein R5R35_006702 [Gryllus longicercus]|uniref:t-SNARE coiled-coil homology domain-containing protein n=1 Tax=Gryllus longicercus TaxID=2509291 RepID=A0AAN9W3M7_9ORTH